jgi:wobble nucleotide-excising tRNase
MPVDIGDPATPLDRPSFKNTLSSGDRTTLALALFFAQLDQDSGRADRVVVFDDPFTSHDKFRRNSTAFHIKRCGETCAQVIVLSHDPDFLKLVWDKIAPESRKTLQLARVGEENTTIAEWDIEKAVQARYRADVDALQNFHNLAEGSPRDVIQKIRPVLEGYCRNLYPVQFLDADMLGTIVGKIRTAGAAHALHPIADDLDELNQFGRRYHHAENPNAASEPIDDNELQGYVKRTLKIAGCF